LQGDIRCVEFVREQKKIPSHDKTPGAGGQRLGGGGKNPVRKESRGNTRRAVADARELSPLAELIHTFSEEGIRFQIAGMSAAVLQGVPATTLDTDIWIDLPEREYVKVLAVCRRLGGETLARTVVALRDDTLVNFLYRVDGLGAFKIEAKRAVRLRWFGMKIDVLPLESIIRSKEAVGREKDLAHLPLLRKAVELRAKTKTS